ncbi:MAG: IS630 transposase-related protein, partial [Culicoidibacterales bacterium]
MATYDLEFKKMIVDLDQSGEAPEKITREYEISKASVYKWKKEL